MDQIPETMTPIKNGEYEYFCVVEPMYDEGCFSPGGSHSPHQCWINRTNFS